MHGFGIFCEGSLLVVERDLAGGAEDGFAQPAEAEQQEERADYELDDGQWNVGERCSERGDDDQ
jgi:hypothetical protein